MKTIGYYDDSSWPGGTTRYLFELLTGLDRSRYRPVLFAPNRRAWHQPAEEMGVEIVCGERALSSTDALDTPPEQLPLHPAPFRPPRGLNAIKARIGWHRWLQREIAELTALFRRRQVDLLHSNCTGEEPAPIAAREAGVAHVVGTLHVEPGYDLFGEHREARHLALQRRSMAALDVAIAVSNHTATAWREHLGTDFGSKARFQVIPNGVTTGGLTRRHTPAEAKVRLGFRADAFVIGSIGRLDYIKGYSELLAALRSPFAEYPEAILVHAGTGPLTEALHAEARRLGIASRVHWLGFQPDVASVLEATDLYLQPSWCECLPYAVLDAGALALPVVASAVGGLSELLDNGNAGWLVPPRDSEALAKAITEGIRNPAERTRRADNLTQRMRAQYTAEAMVKETMACYDSVVSSGELMP